MFSEGKKTINDGVLSGESFESIDDLDGKASSGAAASDLEKNLSIKVMPRKFKVSVPDKQKTQTKAVGAVIMVVGLLVMAAAAYLVYAFLINPKKPSSVVPKPVAPVVETNKPSVKAEDDKPLEKTPEPAQIETPVVPVATSSENLLATSTAEVATSTSPLATSTVSESGAGAVSSQPVIDSDSDGLSDAEESLFGTDILLADSDGDGFSDFSEIGNLYNPAGQGRLESNPNIARYRDIGKEYSVLYPSRWRSQAAGDSMIFSSPDTSFVQIVFEANDGEVGILDWFRNQFPENSAQEANIVAKNGWEGLYGQDKNIFYLTDSARNNIFTIFYVPKNEGDMAYYNIFKTVIASLSFGKE